MNDGLNEGPNEGPTFSDFVFKKDEDGNLKVNIVNESEYVHTEWEESDTPTGYCHTRRFEFLNIDTLTIHDPDKIPDPWDALDALVGMEDIKRQMRRIEQCLAFDRKRIEAGLPSIDTSNHFVFSGNPGTGKNEVARILGALFRDAGLLSVGHVVEVDRSDLVMGWIGQSAVKTSEIIEVAQGGILFIDEAYSLFIDHSWDFGAEVISTIMKAMEDSRKDFVVILAGYKDEIAALMGSNPGFQSRVRHTLDFADYSVTELEDIYKKFCKDSGFRIHENAKKPLRKLMATTKHTNPRKFGNGRFARNAFEKTLEKMALKVAQLDLRTIGDINTIMFPDIPTVEEMLGKSSVTKSIQDKIAFLDDHR